MYQTLVGFLMSPSCCCVLAASTRCPAARTSLCLVEPRLYPSTTNNIPSKPSCCQYWPFFPFHHQHYVYYIVLLWFGMEGISSTSQQCVHTVQVGKICHGDIKLLTQTHLLPFLSGLVRQLPSRYRPLSLPDKSLACRKPGYPNIAGAEDAIQLQKDMEEQHP